MRDTFFIRLCSDLDYEKMVADVCYKNHTIAMITQEEGPENMQIKIFPPEQELESWDLSLDDFLETIRLAKQTLSKMQKLPEA
jgi:hypothetical protein